MVAVEDLAERIETDVGQLTDHVDTDVTGVDELRRSVFRPDILGGDIQPLGDQRDDPIHRYWEA